MKAFVHNTALILPLVVTTIAQTPDNFGIRSSLPLTVHIQPSNLKVTPGLLIPQNDTLAPPSLELPHIPSGETARYVALMIDSAVPVLHWLQADLISSATNLSLHVDTSTDIESSIIGTPYISPRPPAGSGPHNYIILLYEQPSNWSIPSNYSSVNPPTVESDVVGFDVVDFVAASRLMSLVGSNYFRVLNGTAPESSFYATATMTGVITASGVADTTASTAVEYASAGSTEVSGAGTRWSSGVPLLVSTVSLAALTMAFV